MIDKTYFKGHTDQRCHQNCDAFFQWAWLDLYINSYLLLLEFLCCHTISIDVTESEEGFCLLHVLAFCLLEFSFVETSAVLSFYQPCSKAVFHHGPLLEMEILLLVHFLWLIKSLMITFLVYQEQKKFWSAVVITHSQTFWVFVSILGHCGGRMILVLSSQFGYAISL